jgi:hypothetical protein
MADAKVRTRGTVLHIGTTAATASSDTYVEIENTRTIEGTAGISWSSIDATVLKDTYAQVMKGVADAGSLTLGGIAFRDNSGSAPFLAPGLAALKAAAEDDSDPDTYNLKAVDADGLVTYYKVKVMSFTLQRGNNTNLVEFRSMVKLLAAPVEAAAA